MRDKTEKMKLSEHGVIREDALLAYINNELTVDDKRELEKLLKEDPFAQEALEGLQKSNKTKASSVVLNINQRVRERSGLREAKALKMHWTSYAWAAVVLGLLIGVGFVMVTFMNKNGGQLAMNKEAKEQSVMEEKPTPRFEPVNVPATDSVAVTESESPNAITLSTPANPLSPDASGAKKDERAEQQKVELETKTTNGLTVTTAAPGVGTISGNATPATGYNNANNLRNSTLMAGDDKMTTPAKPAPNAGAGGFVGNMSGGGRFDAETQTNERNKLYSYSDKSANQPPASGKKEKAKTAVTSENLNVKDQIAETNGTGETVMRGAILEKVEADKKTVVTMDGATTKFNTGNYKEAAEQFGEILKEQPENPDALYFGGISEYINGNIKKSEKNFDKLLKEGTKFTEGSKWYKANILLKKGKKDEAKILLDELANSNGSYRERAVKKKAEVDF
jgi:TolA-binding protein